MVADENDFLPDDQELHKCIDSEEAHIVNSFVDRKSKLYMKMVGLLVKLIIATSYLKNTMSYMRMTLKITSRLMILMVLRFSYFKVRTFHGTKFLILQFFGNFAKVWNHKIFDLTAFAKFNSCENF